MNAIAPFSTTQYSPIRSKLGFENNDVDIDWSMSVFENNSFNCMSLDLVSFGLEI